MTKEICGAKTTRRPGGTCQLVAGYGTDHPGQGRCKWHGGCNPIKSGRYSKIKREELREAIERHSSAPDPLDMLPELAACRALFEDYINRYDTFTEALIAWHESFGKEGEEAKKPRQILDISDAYRLLSECTKIIKRVEDIKANNAISQKDFFRLSEEMGRVVRKHTDEKVWDDINRDWLAIRL